MAKEFKVVRVYEALSGEKFRKKLEKSLNEVSKEGWELVSLEYLHHSYTAMITISK